MCMINSRVNDKYFIHECSDLDFGLAWPSSAAFKREIQFKD
jgi:hypothetical protein